MGLLGSSEASTFVGFEFKVEVQVPRRSDCWAFSVWRGGVEAQWLLFPVIRVFGVF